MGMQKTATEHGGHGERQAMREDIRPMAAFHRPQYNRMLRRAENNGAFFGPMTGALAALAMAFLVEKVTGSKAAIYSAAFAAYAVSYIMASTSAVNGFIGSCLDRWTGRHQNARGRKADRQP